MDPEQLNRDAEHNRASRGMGAIVGCIALALLIFVVAIIWDYALPKRPAYGTSAPASSITAPPKNPANTVRVPTAPAR